MGSRSITGFLVIFFALIFMVAASVEARKILNIEKREVVPSMKESPVLGSLPQGHALANSDDYQRFTRHLTEIDRILGSVPSPGAGH